MSKDMTPQEIDKALLDPTSVFQKPMDVVTTANIDAATKIEILRRWEYDALEIQVQEEEAMISTPPSDMLDRVLAALHQLGAKPELENTPPTKQGGV